MVDKKPIIEVHTRYKDDDSGPITTGEHFYLKEPKGNWLHVYPYRGGFEISYHGNSVHDTMGIRCQSGNVLRLFSTPMFPKEET